MLVHGPGEVRLWKQVECLQGNLKLDRMFKRRIWRPVQGVANVCMCKTDATS